MKNPIFRRRRKIQIKTMFFFIRPPEPKTEFNVEKSGVSKRGQNFQQM